MMQKHSLAEVCGPQVCDGLERRLTVSQPPGSLREHLPLFRLLGLTTPTRCREPGILATGPSQDQDVERITGCGPC